MHGVVQQNKNKILEREVRENLTRFWFRYAIIRRVKYAVRETK